MHVFLHAIPLFSSGVLPEAQYVECKWVWYTPRAAPLAEVYSSTAVYSIQLYSGIQYTAVYIPPQVMTVTNMHHRCSAWLGMA